jgi:AraC family transcriptional regulator
LSRPSAATPQFFGSHGRAVRAGLLECTISRATVPKEILPEHAHDDAHLILAIDPGYLSRALPRDEWGTGFDLVYNPPGTVHRDCFVEPGGRFMSVAIDNSVIVPRGLPRVIRSPAARRAAFRLLGEIILPAPDPLQVEGHLWTLLAAEDDNEVDLGPTWLGEADALIDARAADPGLTVAKLAAELSLHPVYFARAYRRGRGVGPSSAIQKRRLERAIASMGKPRRLSEVAASCGYADQSHLCRSMRKYLGITPSAIRRLFDEVADVQDTRTTGSLSTC